MGALEFNPKNSSARGDKVKRHLGSFIVASALAACASPPKTAVPEAVSNQEIIVGSFARFGALSPDGRWIAYVRDDAALHSNPQLWIQHVRTGEERRLTFQAGLVATPVFSRDGRFIYFFSNTDELKSDPPELIRALNPNAPRIEGPRHPLVPIEGGDIYRFNLFTNKVERITRQRGFQGFPAPSPDGRGLWYVSSESPDRLELMYLDLKTNRSSRARRSSNLAFDPRPAPDGQTIAWVEAVPGAPVSSLWVADPLFKTPRALALPDGWVASPSWSPSGDKLFFALKKTGAANFGIYSIGLSSGCISVLTQSSYDQVWPQILPGSDRFLLSQSGLAGPDQILIQPADAPQTCLETGAATP
jgi:Tol biopolymer transport system component